MPKPPPSGFGHSYAWEKLHIAADILATGEGSIQQRLFSAMLSALDRIQEEDMPPDLWPELVSIRQPFTAIGRVANRVATRSPGSSTQAA